MNSTPCPQVAEAMARLGQNISMARRRRSLTQAQLAQALNCSEMTVRRLEKGNPLIPTQFLFNACLLFGKLDELSAVLDPAHDTAGIAMQQDRVPLRIRKATQPILPPYDRV